jgi:2-polyprenyl-3-methyl-5-hydroxy-6-metoxy-1,4-benzoquinol methylase
MTNGIDLADIRHDLWFGGGFTNRIEQYRRNKFDEMHSLGRPFEVHLDLEYWQEQTRDAWLDASPETPADVFQFYQSNDWYIPELMLWNVEQVSEIRQYHRWLREYGADSVLDYGAGVGDVPLYLSNEYEAWYADVDGVVADFYEDRAAYRARETPMIRIDEPSFDLREVDKTWDAIICVDVLEHLPDPERVIDAFTASLAPDGLLFTQWTFNDFADDADSVYTPLHIQTGRDVSRRILDHLRADYTQVDGTWSNIVRAWQKDG